MLNKKNNFLIIFVILLFLYSCSKTTISTTPNLENSDIKNKETAEEQITNENTKEEVLKTEKKKENLIVDVDNVKLTPSQEKNISSKIKNEIQKKKYDFPIVINDPVRKYIEAYTTIKRKEIQNALSRAGKYLPMIKKVFREYGLPEDLAYLPIIESGFKLKAVSRARAKGIWQFMKGTGKKFGLKINFWVDERYDPEKSTIAAAKYLKFLYQKYNDWHLVLSAYNAGEGKISRAIRKKRTTDYWELRKSRYLRRETKGYVPAFIAALLIAKDPEDYGFSPVIEEPIKYEIVEIPSPVDLRVVSRISGIDYSTIKEYNPELIRGITPSYTNYYPLKVPIGIEQEKLSALSNLPVSSRIYSFIHTVRRGESLYYLARKYGTSVHAIKSINRLRSNLIKPGMKLIIPKLKVRRITYKKIKPDLNKIRSKNYKLHRVSKGETLYRISKTYNVDVSKLKRWNNLRSNIIHPGDLLIIYIN